MASDFTQNIPVHRLFKTAMNFIKFLLHKNYHHSEEHDTFLPVTNLYLVKTNWETEKIIRHQIEAFMRPITRVKRYDSYNSCNPIGIALYAESFLHIFEKNGFISDKDANFLHKFIDIQKDEIRILCEDNNTISGFFLTQKNILATITAGLTFLLATIAIIEFLFKENALNKCNLHPDIKIVPHIIVILIAFGCGVLIKNWAVRRTLSKRKFYKKKKKRNFLNKNSDITNGKLSFLYALRLFLIEIKLSIKNFNIYTIEIIKFLSIAILFAIVVFLAYRLLYHFVFI
jgi:hypothetical protein